MYGGETWDGDDNVMGVCGVGGDWAGDQGHADIVVIVAVVIGFVVVVTLCFLGGRFSLRGCF